MGNSHCIGPIQVIVNLMTAASRYIPLEGEIAPGVAVRDAEIEISGVHRCKNDNPGRGILVGRGCLWSKIFIL